MLPNFHDGRLSSLSVSEHAAAISIIRVDGAKWQIELFGVRYLKADDFREGNIIASLEAITAAEPPRWILENLVTAPHPSAAAEYQHKYRAHIDGLVAEIVQGKLILISITPSYGCELTAVCETCTGVEVR